MYTCSTHFNSVCMTFSLPILNKTNSSCTQDSSSLPPVFFPLIVPFFERKQIKQNCATNFFKRITYVLDVKYHDVKYHFQIFFQLTSVLIVCDSSSDYSYTLPSNSPDHSSLAYRKLSNADLR